MVRSEAAIPPNLTAPIYRVAGNASCRPEAGFHDRPLSGRLPADLGREIHSGLDRLELRLVADRIECPIDAQDLKRRVALLFRPSEHP